MKFAAIDIGSNAIRLQLTKAYDDAGSPYFKKLEYVRFPLRLGADVFTMGRIGEERSADFLKLMQAFKLLVELYKVDDSLAVGTSALREAENGADLVAQANDQFGLDIEVISGHREAELIELALGDHLQKQMSYLHIDVGGGSTELNRIEHGEKVADQSFPVGSVRRLQSLDKPETWDDMQQWISESNQQHGPVDMAVGTGGNINKLYELSKSTHDRKVSLGALKDTQAMLRQMNLDDRMNKLRLNPDRADVIVPASEIYLQVMDWSGVEDIVVPDVGLKDGVMKKLWLDHKSELPEYPG